MEPIALYIVELCVMAPQVTSYLRFPLTLRSIMASPASTEYDIIFVGGELLLIFLFGARCLTPRYSWYERWCSCRSARRRRPVSEDSPGGGGATRQERRSFCSAREVPKPPAPGQPCHQGACLGAQRVFGSEAGRHRSTCCRWSIECQLYVHPRLSAHTTLVDVLRSHHLQPSCGV